MDKRGEDEFISNSGILISKGVVLLKHYNSYGKVKINKITLALLREAAGVFIRRFQDPFSLNRASSIHNGILQAVAKKGMYKFRSMCSKDVAV